MIRTIPLSATVLLAGLAGATVAAPPAGAEAAPAHAPAAEAPAAEAPRGERVGGDRDAEAVWTGRMWRFDRCRIDTPLPEGYPAPTPPGAIEIKSYPSVRRAEVRGDRNPDLGMNLAFWPLFNHIKGREIAMTSPVEMDYRALERDDGLKAGGWTMSFLYRTADLGPTGRDGAVEVVDAPPLTVLAIGLRGPYRLDTMAEPLAQLEAWLAEHADAWERAGEPRGLFYNGPEARAADRWLELQVPVRARTPAAPAADGA